MSAAQIYQDIWLSDAGGSSCSGFAVFLQKVLTLFDIPAFTVDVGYAGTPLTHVTTLVPYLGKFYLFDPTLGGVYVDRSGQYVDFPSVVAGAKSSFQASPISRTMFIPLNRIAGAKQMFERLHLDPQCSRESSYMKCERVPYSAAILRDEWANDLKKQGIPQDADLIVALLKHKIQSIGATGPVRKQFLAAMAKSLNQNN